MSKSVQHNTSVVFDTRHCLEFSRDLVGAKIVNQRTMVRRNWRGDHNRRKEILDRLNAARKAAKIATSASTLLGLEGNSAAIYFQAFSDLLVPATSKKPSKTGEDLKPFRFDKRNRRPPTDPINAVLSLAYAMLTRHLTVALATVGLDPYRGFFHAPRYGKTCVGS